MKWEILWMTKCKFEKLCYATTITMIEQWCALCIKEVWVEGSCNG